MNENYDRPPKSRSPHPPQKPANPTLPGGIVRFSQGQAKPIAAYWKNDRTHPRNPRSAF
ncbi:MAG: hypothetical protein VKJ24_00605 [Synechococcales bacterium]|nr:hypothetical protein [Synechococcales bacterium]